MAPAGVPGLVPGCIDGGKVLAGVGVGVTIGGDGWGTVLAGVGLAVMIGVDGGGGVGRPKAVGLPVGAVFLG